MAGAALLATVGPAALARHGSERPGARLLLNPNLDPRVVRMRAAEHRRAVARAKRRRTAKARRARRKSRRAYSHLTGRKPMLIAASHFRRTIDEPVWHGLPTRPGERVRGFINPATALIDNGDGTNAVAQGSFPLAVQGADGSQAAVDLSLHNSGDGLAPAVSAIPMHFPRNAASGITFGSAAIRIKPTGGSGQDATMIGDKAFYANVATDTDLLVKPLPIGIETLTQIRSAAAPEDQTFALDLPPGAELRATGPDLAPGALEIVRGSRILARILPPTASDADGVSVPVSYQVDGNRLTMRVTHREGDFRYPILVDPVWNVTEDFRLPGQNTTGFSDSTSWYAQAWGGPWSMSYTPPPGAGYVPSGLATWPTGTHSTPFDLARWLWPDSRSEPNGTTDYKDTYLYRADGSELIARGGTATSPATCAWNGVLDPSQPDWDNHGAHVYDPASGAAVWAVPCDTDHSAYTRAWCVVNSCSPGAGTPGNQFDFEVRSNLNGALSGAFSELLWIVIYRKDPYPPTVDPPVQAAGQDLSQWQPENTSLTTSGTAHDRGFGLREGEVVYRIPGGYAPVTSGSGTAAGSTTGNPVLEHCYAAVAQHSAAGSPDQGDRNNHCPLSDTYSFTYNTSSLPEGVNNLGIDAYDINGAKGGPATNGWVVKVDRTPPVIDQPSGTLWNARGTTLADGTYTLHVHATDGSTSSPAANRSGVATIDISVDGERQDSVDQSCPTGSCDLARDWTLNTADYSGGQHTVEIVATDALGHVSTTSFAFSRGCCMSAVSDWGGFTPAVNDVAYGDVNGDGLDDAVARNRLTGDVQVSLATGTGFAPAQSWGNWSPLYDFHLADVNGDGYADIVGRNSVSDVSVALGTGSGFGAAASWGTLPSNYSLSLADVDVNGGADLIGTDSNSGQIVVGYADDGYFDPVSGYATADAGFQTRFADVDGDGAADLVEVNPNTGEVRVAISDGATFGPSSSWGTYGANVTLLFGDTNLDGQADVVAIDKSTGEVKAGATNGIGFDALTHYGSWDNSYTPQVADLDGNGNVDIVGQNSLTGEIAGATTDGPAAPDVAPDTYTPDPDVPWGGDVLDGSGGLSSASSSSPPHLKLGVADFDRLQGGATSDQACQNGTSTQPTCSVNHIYDRFQQAGVSVVRFQANWGDMQNVPGSSQPYDFSRLDAAVKLARMRGIDVELTISGNKPPDPCAADPNSHDCQTSGACTNFPNSISCKGFDTHLVDPTTSSYTTLGGSFIQRYGAFVTAVVNHYTRDPNGTPLNAPGAANPLLFIKSFSIWNEPNFSGWLQVRGDKLQDPTTLYRSLYQAGYGAYSSAISSSTPQAVTGTQIFIGELSSDTRGGKIPGDCPKSCILTAPEWLAKVANDSSQPLLANGVAYHPYQFYPHPWSANVPPHKRGGKVHQTGIALLGRVLAKLEAICQKGTDAFNNRVCKGGLRTPGAIPKNPALFLTEFGYLNQPHGKSSDNYHTEYTRKSWFYPTPGHVGALDQAASYGRVMWLVLYHAVELRPGEAHGWDSGLIGPPPGPNEAPNSDIIGDRGYGKDHEHNGQLKTTGITVLRQAYCSIRKWAVNHKYPGATSLCPSS